jgi:GTPase SAR1 family protein
MESNERSVFLRVSVLGDIGSGKSSLCARVETGVFSDVLLMQDRFLKKSSTGVDPKRLEMVRAVLLWCKEQGGELWGSVPKGVINHILEFVKWNLQESVKVIFLDILLSGPHASAEQNWNRVRHCFRAVDLLLMCFDCSNRSSLTSLLGPWTKEATRCGPSLLQVFVGTKSDLVGDEKERVELKELVPDEWPVFFCSAKTGEGVESLVEYLVNFAFTVNRNPPKINLLSATTEEKKKCAIC